MKYILKATFPVLLAPRFIRAGLFTKIKKSVIIRVNLWLKTSLFPENTAKPRNLFLRNEPNFNYTNIIAISYSTVGYNDLQTKTQNGTNPNEPNFLMAFFRKKSVERKRHDGKKYHKNRNNQTKNKIMQFKAKFKIQKNHKNLKLSIRKMAPALS